MNWPFDANAAEYFPKLGSRQRRMAPAAYRDSQRLGAESTEYFLFALKFPGCALRRTAPAQ